MTEDQQIRAVCLDLASRLMTQETRLFPDFIMISMIADHFASYVKTGKVHVQDHFVRDKVIYPEGVSTCLDAIGEVCYGDTDMEVSYE